MEYLLHGMVCVCESEGERERETGWLSLFPLNPLWIAHEPSPPLLYLFQQRIWELLPCAWCLWPFALVHDCTAASFTMNWELCCQKCPKDGSLIDWHIKKQSWSYSLVLGFQKWSPLRYHIRKDLKSTAHYFFYVSVFEFWMAWPSLLSGSRDNACCRG